MEAIVLTSKAFRELPEYSCTIPTGTTIGKRWKRHTPDDNWYQGEYFDNGVPGQVGIRWNRIQIKGELGGPCNRTACSTPATHWNISTRAYYCRRCARIINQHAPYTICFPGSVSTEKNADGDAQHR